MDSLEALSSVDTRTVIVKQGTKFVLGTYNERVSTHIKAMSNSGSNNPNTSNSASGSGSGSSAANGSGYSIQGTYTG